jgi:hypothetical protein
MKRLEILAANPAEAFDACTNGIDDPALVERFSAARAEMLIRFQEYLQRGAIHQLYLSTASAWGNENQIVIGGMSKKELVSLYSDQMVGDGKPGRRYYDRIMMQAPLGKCPFCGFGHVSTLDHFLSKSRYPTFSVLLANLVPSCGDCNKGKGAPVVRENEQLLHPYFEDERIQRDTWIFAEVIESTPPTVRYFVEAPNTWPADLVQRANNSFNDFGLARRFAVEAASELSGLRDMLADMQTHEMREDHLQRTARVERRERTNSWKAALYEALSQSDWYLEHGYNHGID